MVSAIFFFFFGSVSASIFLPGQTLNPDCAMGSANCGVNILSEFVPYSGASSTIDLNEQQLLNVGDVSIGTTTSGTALLVIGTTTVENLVTVNNPDGIGTSSQDSGTAFTAGGNFFEFHVYAYKIIAGVRVFSQNYTDITFTDDNSLAGYQIGLRWNPVAGADGYRVVIVEDDVDGYAGNYSVDTATSSIEYDGSHGIANTALVTPTSPYLFGGFLQVGGSGSITGDLSVSNDLTVAGSIVNNINTSKTVSQIATTSVGNGPLGIAVSGRYAYVTNENSNSVSVVDISNPMASRQIATTSIGNYAQDIAVAGQYAYAANSNSNSISVVDVSDPHAPVQVATTSVGSFPFGIAVSGHYLYTSNIGDNTLSVVDISNPRAPVQVATASVDGPAFGVAVSGHYAYTANGSANTLSVVDISNPRTPVQVATTSVGVGTTPSRIAISGSYAYVTNRSANTLSVVDISNPRAPVQVATASVGQSPFGVSVSGRYAYVANGGGYSASIVDISNPRSPAVVGTISPIGNPQLVAVSGHHLYLTNENFGTISIVDLDGIDTGNLSAGAIEAGNINTDNDITVGGSVNVSNTLFIGAGGILSNGALAVTATDTPSSFADKVGIGTTTPTAMLTISGTPTSTLLRLAGFGAGSLSVDSLGNVTESSDERLKNIVGNFMPGLTEVEGLTPINYHWNATSGLDMADQYSGFSAQNVQQYIPEAVATDSRGYLTLDDRPIIAALVNAVKSIGSFISSVGNGLAHLTGIAIGTSAKPEGLTMYDQVTGQPYCLVMSNGIFVHNPGECQQIQSTSTQPVLMTSDADEAAALPATTTATSTDALATSSDATTTAQNAPITDASSSPLISTSSESSDLSTTSDQVSTTSSAIITDDASSSVSTSSDPEN